MAKKTNDKRGFDANSKGNAKKKPADLTRIEYVEPFCKLLDDYRLTEISLENEDFAMTLKRERGRHPRVVEKGAIPARRDDPAIVADTTSDKTRGNRTVISSPIVGTVYLSPQPGSPDFVKVGDTVNEGDTLLLVESMKVFNPISAPGSGVIKEIAVVSAQTVEYDETLMIIE